MNSFKAQTLPHMANPATSPRPLVDTQHPMYVYLLPLLEETVERLNTKTGSVWQMEFYELYMYTGLPEGTRGPWFYMDIRFRRGNDPWVWWKTAPHMGDLVEYYESELVWYYLIYKDHCGRDVLQGRNVEPVVGYYQERREELAADIPPAWGIRKRKGVR